MWRVVPPNNTLQIRAKQQVARIVIADMEAYLTAHPETKAVHVPELVEPYGLGAAALYWGDGIRLFFPAVQWVPSRDAVTQPTTVFHVEGGHLVPRDRWLPES